MKYESAFSSYLAYQDTQSNWLGRIPSIWKVQAFRRVATILNGADHKPFEVDEGGFPVFGSGGEFARCKQYLSRGPSLLLGRKGTINRPLFVEEPFWAVDTTYYTKFGTGCFAKFFHYVALACFPLDMYTYGSALPSMTQRDYYTFPVPVPSPNEQLIISTFLDRETTRIDALITKQNRLIALLDEKRQAVISHAVTKGLDSNVPVKDSGIEWLGEVPAHWKILPVKRTAHKITDGAHISPETEDGKYAFVSTRDIRGKGIDFQNCLMTSESSFDYLVHSGCAPQLGDVLFSKDGTIGKTVVVSDDRPFVVASSLIIIRPDRSVALSVFLDYVLSSSHVLALVDLAVKGAGLPRLSIQNLQKVIVIVPPLIEQEAIVAFLDHATEKIDTLIEKAKQSIELMKERRSALISAAVTGKIDVRELV